MRNIASYQEGFTDGYQNAKDVYIQLVFDFIREQKEEEPDRPYLRGYNQALRDLEEFIGECL